jgi:hypothetical protein
MTRQEIHARQKSLMLISDLDYNARDKTEMHACYSDASRKPCIRCGTSRSRLFCIRCTGEAA